MGRTRILCQWSIAFPEGRCREWATWSSPEITGLCDYVCDKHKNINEGAFGSVSPWTIKIKP